MKIFMCSVFIIVSVLFTTPIAVQSRSSSVQLIRRQFHDGVLYEDFATDSASIRYSIENGKGWDDLDTLAKENYLIAKSMFCSIGPAAWLLYPDVSFGTTSRQTVKLLYGEMCVPLDNVNSLQPIGAVDVLIPDFFSAVTFSEKHFSSAVHTVRNGSEPSAIKSAIFMGHGNWTLNSGEGKKICLSTVGIAGDVCLLNDIESAFGTTVSIHKECDEDDDDIDLYGLQSCFATGYREITYEADFSVEGMQKICSGGYESTDQSKDKFLAVMDVWSRRISGNLYTTEEVEGINRIKLELVPLILDLVDSTCTNLDDDYLGVLLGIMLNVHLQDGKVWGEDNSTSNETSNVRVKESWEETTSFFAKCQEAANSASIQFDVGCSPLDANAVPDFDRLQILEDYLNGESYDFVIEQFYLIFSYVSAYCSYTIGTAENSWAEIPLILKEEYLYPIREQWLNPGRISNYYPLMFNGFDIEKEKKILIGCVQAAVIQTPFYDPLARPPEFTKEGNNSALEGYGPAAGSKKTDAGKKDARRKRFWTESSEESDENLGTGDKTPVSPNAEASSSTATSKSKEISSNQPKTAEGTLEPSSAIKSTAAKVITSPTTSETLRSPQSTSATATSTSTTTTEPPVSSASSKAPAEEEERTPKKQGRKKKKHAKKAKRGKKHSRLLRKNKPGKEQSQEADKI